MLLCSQGYPGTHYTVQADFMLVVILLRLSLPSRITLVFIYFDFLRQSLTVWLSLALHSWQSPCLSLPSIGIPGVCHFIFLQSWTSHVPGKLCSSEPHLYPAGPWGSFASQGPPDSGDGTGEAYGNPATERTVTTAKVLEPGTVLPREPELAAPTTVELTGKEAEAESLLYWIRQTWG